MTEDVAPLGRRERKKQALRARIVLDCCTLIAELGVEGTKLDTLCDRVDISKKTFYNYFDSKDTLLLEICQSHLLTGMETAIETALASGADCGTQLEMIFRALFEGQADAGRFDLELIDYLVSNFASNRGASIGLLDEMNGHYIRFFRHHRDVLRPEYTPEFCGEMAVGMLVSVILNWMNHPDSDGAAKLPEVADYIRRSMLVDAGPGAG